MPAAKKNSNSCSDKVLWWDKGLLNVAMKYGGSHSERQKVEQHCFKDLMRDLSEGRCVFPEDDIILPYRALSFSKFVSLLPEFPEGNRVSLREVFDMQPDRFVKFLYLQWGKGISAYSPASTHEDISRMAFVHYLWGQRENIFAQETGGALSLSSSENAQGKYFLLSLFAGLMSNEEWASFRIVEKLTERGRTSSPIKRILASTYAFRLLRGGENPWDLKARSDRPPLTLINMIFNHPSMTVRNSGLKNDSVDFDIQNVISDYLAAGAYAGPTSQMTSCIQPSDVSPLDIVSRLLIGACRREGSPRWLEGTLRDSWNFRMRGDGDRILPIVSTLIRDYLDCLSDRVRVVKQTGRQREVLFIDVLVAALCGIARENHAKEIQGNPSFSNIWEEHIQAIVGSQTKILRAVSEQGLTGRLRKLMSRGGRRDVMARLFPDMVMGCDVLFGFGPGHLDDTVPIL